MTSKPKVAIGIPAYGPQPPSFWLPYSESVSTLHKDDIDFIGTYWKGTSEVAINRNVIVDEWYKDDGAEWLWWIDADNPPPIGALKRLLALDRPLVSGVYYSTQKENIINPIAYRRDRKTGVYYSLKPDNWEHGELKQVDAVGMGCFLTHRDVYSGIMEMYEVYQRAYGGVLAIHKDKVRGKVPNEQVKHPYVGQIKDGIFYEPVVKNSIEDTPFPFFMSQHTRTEDMHFCELARDVGYEIWLDTSVESPHCKERIITGTDFRDQERPDVAPQEIEDA
jgi:hypothetical protein